MVLALLAIPVNASALLIDFDSLTAGDTVNEVDGVSFSSNTGLGLIVSDIFDTTSGENYLGVNDGADEVFLGSFNDQIYLSFSQDVIGISVSFVGAPANSVEYQIITPSGMASSDDFADSILPDGGEVFGVSFSSLTAFTEATLTGISELASYNIDDIEITFAEPVPEPGTVVLFLSGLAGIHAFRERRKKGSALPQG